MLFPKTTRAVLPTSFPCAAAKLLHKQTFTESFGMPTPLVYIQPKFTCAFEWPWSAALHHINLVLPLQLRPHITVASSMPLWAEAA